MVPPVISVVEDPSENKNIATDRYSHCGVFEKRVYVMILYFSQACPYLSNWSAYGACDVSCGGGLQVRSRQCVYGDIGVPGCDSDVFQSIRCNEQVTRTFMIIGL